MGLVTCLDMVSLKLYRIGLKMSRIHDVNILFWCKYYALTDL